MNQGHMSELIFMVIRMGISKGGQGGTVVQTASILGTASIEVHRVGGSKNL